MLLLEIDWGVLLPAGIPIVVLLGTTAWGIYRAIKGGKKWTKALLDEKDTFIDLYKQVNATIKAAKKASDSGQVVHKLLVEHVDEKVLGKLDEETKKQLNIAAAPIQDIVNAELAKNGILDDEKLKTLVNAVNSGATANETWKKWVDIGGSVVSTAAKVAL